VLENDLGPGKSWNLLGNDADCEHNDANTDAKIWHKLVLPMPSVSSLF